MWKHGCTRNLSFVFAPLLVIILSGAALSTPIQYLTVKESLGHAPQGYFAPHLEKAVHALSSGNLKRAQDLIARAEQTKKSLDKLYLLKGICLAEQGQHEEAITAYRASLALRGSNSDTLYYLALSQIKLNRFKDAYDSLDEAVWFKGGKMFSLAEFHMQMAKIHLITTDLEEAGKSLEKALAAKEDFLPAVSLLAEVRVRQGRKTEALALLRRNSSQESQTNPEVKMLLGEALLMSADRRSNKKDIAEAESLMKEVLESGQLQDAQRVRATRIYVLALIEGGKLEEAQIALTPALKEFSGDLELNKIKDQLDIEKLASRAG